VSQRRKKLDPVTQYAAHVVNGTGGPGYIAGRSVRLACERHLRDLEQAEQRGLEWRPKAAQEVIDFFAEVLRLPENTDATDDADDTADEGKPFVLSPFQQFIAGSLFGWYTKAGHRRFRMAYVETAKGSGKTPFGAGLMLYLLVADGERGAQVYAAAPTLKQAQDAFRDAERMVEASPDLRALVDSKVNNLAVLSTGSFFRPISSEKRGLDGKRVHGGLVDELHEHPTDVVTAKLRAGTKGRRSAVILEITNSGFDRETVCYKHHDYSRQILEGLVENDAWFAYICHLDACDMCAEAGHYQPSDDCPDCDDWKTEGDHWRKANPNLGVSLPWQYLREQVREAVDMPSQRNMVRRLNFCQWTQQKTAFIATERWAACASDAVTFDGLRGRACYIGIDLSAKIDLSSVNLVFPRAINGGADFAADILPYFWMPKNTLHRRAQEDKVPYPDWVREGWVNETPGDIVDHDAIIDFVINVLAKQFKVRGIGFDQAGAAAAVTRLQRHFGEAMVIEIPQGFRTLSEPTKQFEALIVGDRLRHNGNKCMAWNVSNLAIEENHWNEIRPVKIDQRKRIDGGVAAIIALALAIRAPMDVPSSFGFSGGVIVRPDGVFNAAGERV
jgi:phage terminase large subunit-like protein